MEAAGPWADLDVDLTADERRAALDEAFQQP
jgi:hypothetical protein